MIGSIRPPPAADLEQLGSGDEQEQDGSVDQAIRDMLDEIEQRGLGPLDVVEDDDQRPPARQVLQQVAHRPGHLLRRCRLVDQPRDRCDPTLDELGVLEPVHDSGDPRPDRGRLVRRVDPGRCMHDLDQRPPGDPVAVR